jgi:hypothetical protein
MSIHFDDLAEGKPMTDLTLAQWARAKALAAVLGSGQAQNPRSVADMTYAYAVLIITGELGDPPDGMFW